ncbi:MAG: DUF1592 domain-containing protein [Bryobacteraceae bacterium]
MRILVLSLAAVAVWAQTPALDFAKDVFPILQRAQCGDCHQSNGVASTTRLLFPEFGASPEEINAFGDSLRLLVDRSSPAQSLLFSKPTQRATHAGGQRIKQGSPEEKTWQAWVDHLAATEGGGKKSFARKAGERTVLRRLTHAQYDNTVADLLGDRTRPSQQFPAEDYIDGFKNQYEGQSVSPILAEAYGSAAEKVAANWQGKDPGARFVADFGRRAFRRPLTAEESRRYANLYKTGGAKLVIEAMLQSPAFLFRTEATSIVPQKPFARAARLSYLLWDTMPDEALLDDAAKGKLETAAGMEAAARRLLDNPRARQAVDQFIAQWLGLESVVTMVKERRAFPSFSRELALAMTEETRRLAQDLIWNDRNFMDLYTAGYSFLNADLAALYGVQAPSEEFAKVSFPTDSERGGLLGHASVLALTSKPGETSITSRGLFVREHLLCQKIPQPPPGVSSVLPVSTEERPMTNREKLGVHLASPICASCHNLVDPIGYGLEKFDGIGARREKMKVDVPRYNRREQNKTVEVPIDNSGWVAGIQDSKFSSPKQLGNLLSANVQCQECVVKQYFRYAMGRHETTADRAVIERVTEDFRKSGFKFQQLMISLLKWTEFPPPAAMASAGAGGR